MKKIFKAILLLTALSYVFTGTLKAQGMNPDLAFLYGKNTPLLKMNANAFAMAYSMYSESGNDEIAKAKSDVKAKKMYLKTIKASNRASLSFSRSFKKIASPEWQVQKNAIVAKFNENEIRTYVVYDKNGRWVRNMSYLFPNRIPEKLWKEVSRNYPEYKINMALEITEFNAILILYSG